MNDDDARRYPAFEPENGPEMADRPAPADQPDMPDAISADEAAAMLAPDVVPEPESVVTEVTPPETAAVVEAAIEGNAAAENAGAAWAEGDVQAALPAEALSEVPAVAPPATPARHPDSLETRIDVLCLAIERYPEAAVNYVLRGECYLDLGDRECAARDFETALRLADSAADVARWGYVDRAIADRARRALKQLGLG